MASLVADYGTDSDSVDECVDNEVSHEQETSATVSVQGMNFLSADDINTSDESEDEEHKKDATDKVFDNPFVAEKKKLPNPLAENRMGKKGSVFITEYQIAAASKNSILEQHVKMTERPSGQERTIGGKKVCWNYRKMGRCNKGHKCPYAHDSDLSGSGQSNSADASNTAHKLNAGSLSYSYHGNAMPPETVDDDNYMSQAKKRKRVGVRNGLVPPKKALTQLDKMREKERPWTKST